MDEVNQLRWVKIRSLHIVRSVNPLRTLCGRSAYGVIAESLPAGWKSCESCLRIVALATDHAETERGVA